MVKTVYRSTKWLETSQCMLSLNSSKLILDVGCGEGHELRVFSLLGHNCIGIELVRRHAITAKRDAKVDVIVANAQNLPLQAKVFDVVYSNEFFSHAEDPDKALLEQIRVLRSKGKLLVRDSNLLCPVTFFDLLLLYPIRTKGRQGGLKWLMRKNKTNIYPRGFKDKDENIHALVWWKKKFMSQKDLKLDVATTATAERIPKIFALLLRHFLGQCILVATKKKEVGIYS